MDLDPEEAAALEAATGGVDEGGARVAVVSLRDFSEPRTLSADRIARIRKTLFGPVRGRASPRQASELLTISKTSLESPGFARMRSDAAFIASPHAGAY